MLYYFRALYYDNVSSPIRVYTYMGEERNPLDWSDGKLGVLVQRMRFTDEGFRNLNKVKVGELVIIKNHTWRRFE